MSKMSANNVSQADLAAEYEKAKAIMKSGFRTGHYSKPQAGFVLGTLDKLWRAINGQP